MKKITIKKRSATITAGVLALALIGGTLAYYTSNGVIENQLKTKTPGGEQMVEQFTPENDWTPGQKVVKKAGLENKGEVSLLVRVKMHEVWTLADGTTTVNNNSTAATFDAGTGQADPADGLTTGDGSVVAKEMTNTNWVKGATDGYWYYNAILAPAGNTGDFLSSITLNSATDMGLKGTIMYYTTAAAKPADNVMDADPSQGWKTFTGEVPAGATFSRSVSSVDGTKAGYAGATYSLYITYETYQATPEARTEAVTGGWDSAKTPAVS